MYRLADYEQSRDYYHHLNELLELCDNQELRALCNLVEQLDESKHRFGWIGDYDIFLFSQIVPHIRKTLENLDAKESQTIVNFIDMYLSEYRKMVSYECSRVTRSKLQEFFEECFLPMQECAVKFLMQEQNVDIVIVGMRKPLYVHQILSLRE